MLIWDGRCGGDGESLDGCRTLSRTRMDGWMDEQVARGIERRHTENGGLCDKSNLQLQRLHTKEEEERQPRRLGFLL